MSGWSTGREGIGTASQARVSGHFGTGPRHKVSGHFGARQRGRALGQFVAARWRAWGIKTVGVFQKKVSLRTNFSAQHGGGRLPNPTESTMEGVVVIPPMGWW